jgi:SpoU rRNA methylase family enzyme
MTIRIETFSAIVGNQAGFKLIVLSRADGPAADTGVITNA